MTTTLPSQGDRISVSDKIETLLSGRLKKEIKNRYKIMLIKAKNGKSGY